MQGSCTEHIWWEWKEEALGKPPSVIYVSFMYIVILFTDISCYTIIIMIGLPIFYLWYFYSSCYLNQYWLCVTFTCRRLCKAFVLLIEPMWAIWQLLIPWLCKAIIRTGSMQNNSGQCKVIYWRLWRFLAFCYCL